MLLIHVIFEFLLSASISDLVPSKEITCRVPQVADLLSLPSEFAQRDLLDYLADKPQLQWILQVRH